MAELFREIYQDVLDSRGEILDNWQAVCQEEPWVHLPADFDLDHLPDLVQDLVDVALRGPFDREICERKLTTAADHGQYRMEQGFGEAMIFREYYILRQSIWMHVKERHTSRPQAAFEAIVRIDSAITLMTKASLRGFFRVAFEKQGRWAEAIHELVDEWTMLPGPEAIA